ncbi:ANTAR domain-containing protein [Nakamurella sp. GG22]
MTIVEEFQDAVHSVSVPADTGPARLPIRLTKACVRVLPVIGAGLSLFSAPTMRIPIGASDDTAAVAERLQFTVADGPCYAAHQTGRPVIAGTAAMAHRWPLYYDQLVTQTSVRGVLSTPLPGPLIGVGVLDLYVDHPEDLDGLRMDHVAAVAEHIAHRLTAGPMLPSLRDASPWAGPPWMTDPSGGRGNVMLAMGMLNVALGLRMDDALAALQAHAFAHGRTVDSIASDIVQRALPPTALANDSII